MRGPNRDSLFRQWHHLVNLVLALVDHMIVSLCDLFLWPWGHWKPLKNQADSSHLKIWWPTCYFKMTKGITLSSMVNGFTSLTRTSEFGRMLQQWGWHKQMKQRQRNWFIYNYILHYVSFWVWVKIFPGSASTLASWLTVCLRSTSNFKKQCLLMTYSSRIEHLLSRCRLLCSSPWVTKGKQQEEF